MDYLSIEESKLLQGSGCFYGLNRPMNNAFFKPCKPVVFPEERRGGRNATAAKLLSGKGTLHMGYFIAD
jgi:hypothetical protein